MSREMDLIARRLSLIDVYPRELGATGRNYNQPGAAAGESYTEETTEQAGGSFNPLASITPPSPRPIVFQQANNIVVAAGLNPVPLMQNSFAADAVVLSVPNGGTTCFLGYGSGITTGSGIPIIANQPVLFSPDNTRELWELQRLLEMILAVQLGGQQAPQYRAPRVAFDPSSYYLVSTAAQNVACMVFFVPEGQ